MTQPPFTLAVDIGGTTVKSSVLDVAGAFLVPHLRTETPSPAPPAAVMEIIATHTAQLPGFDRISVGFPGMVRGGTVVTAPNLGTSDWSGFAMIATLARRYRVPVRLLNDAGVQGLGVVEGPGLECTLTFGTGVGCALFRDRAFLLHLELGQWPAPEAPTYDAYAGQAALAALGDEAWNLRVRRTIALVTDLTCCDRIYAGGGNARRISPDLPAHVRLVNNSAGISGGVRLWEAAFDAMFAAEPMAHPGWMETQR